VRRRGKKSDGADKPPAAPKAAAAKAAAKESGAAPFGAPPPAKKTTSGGGGGGGGNASRNAPPASARAPRPPPPPPPRVVTLLEPDTGRRLECLLRRRVPFPGGGERAILTPLDPPVTILRADAEQDFTEVEEDELPGVLPACGAALLAPRGRLLRAPPVCLTLRGALCYNETDVITLEENEGGKGRVPTAPIIHARAPCKRPRP
jgi:hypothetical protein